MPIPGDMLKNSISRGGNLIYNGVKDFVFGYKAKAGKIKLNEEESGQFADFLSAGGHDMPDFPLAKEFRNRDYLNQNNLEAFYLDQGKTFEEGDTLSLSGFDALRSRFIYKSPSANKVMFGGKSEVSTTDLMVKDGLDVAAATAAGIVGLKVTQAGVSLLTGD